MILKNAQKEIEQEQREREAFQQKILNAKNERDTQLRIAEEKKKTNFASQRKQEIDEVQRMQEAIKKDKEDQRQRKIK